MSGGRFDYKQFLMEDVADDIAQLIDDTIYPPEIIEKFKEAAHTVHQAAEMVQRVDWLVCCDDGEDSFLRRWEEEVRPHWNDAKSAQ